MAEGIMMQCMAVEDVLAEIAVFSTNDVPYIPLPNIVDVIISAKVAPRSHNPTAFVVAFMDNGDLVLADNLRRGAEVCGGRIEGNETAAEAAIRESGEEAGAVLKEITPLGIFRSHTTGERPEDYGYPYPTSFQQFFTGIVDYIDLSLVKKDESAGPIFVSPADAGEVLKSKPKEFVLYKHALSVLFPDLAREHGFIEASPTP